MRLPPTAKAKGIWKQNTSGATPLPASHKGGGDRAAEPGRLLLFCLVCALISGLPIAAHAGPIVDRIKSAGVIRCGGVPRPGLVGQSPDGREAAGLYLDLCRAIGAALLGGDGKIEFHSYDSDHAFERVEDGADDLSFVDGSDIADHRLAGKIALGPAVYFVSTAAMVRGDSEVERLGDLAGQPICFYQGDSAHRHLEGWMAAHRLSFARMGYMEYGELHDAFNARICDAEVGESGDLAAARLQEGAATPSRILAEPLATFPVFAATPAGDPQWSAIVAWAIYALQRAELPASTWAAAGVDSLGVEGRELGLADDWLKRVVGAAGSYADIYARNLGDRSRLKLARGSNAPAEAGGLFVTPYRE
jgi:general L-amino acid transport system substrate-binding protein